MTRSPLERVVPSLLTAMPPLRPLLFLAALCLLLAAEAIAARSGPTGWRVVLVAGDNAQPVFDNAVAAVRNWLTAGGVPAQNIQVLSATPQQGAGAAAEPAWAGWILARVAELRPAPGEACLVFITSHGQRGKGIALAYGGEFLRPAELAQALSAGCARSPTVVIVSGCYTGGFTAMRAPNRIVITAARADRASFGCAVERTYAVFDECLLSSLSQASLPQAMTWRAVFDATRGCVSARERELQATPSEPQAVFGEQVRNLPVR
jgi:hypothetical protein